MSFNPNPCQMNCYPSPNTNQGTHFLNITIPISLCTNPLTFASLSPLAYDTNYYVVHCLSNKAKLRKTIICTKSIHLSCISTYTNTISLPTKNPNIKYLALLPSFVHHPPLLNRATILQKIATPHPSTIPSTNWNLDIMKNRHQNHTSSKLLLQTRCPHSPISMNADLVNIKQNKQTYIILNNA
jgi:hypothetical protein